MDLMLHHRLCRLEGAGTGWHELHPQAVPDWLHVCQCVLLD